MRTLPLMRVDSVFKGSPNLEPSSLFEIQHGKVVFRGLKFIRNFVNKFAQIELRILKSAKFADLRLSTRQCLVD